VSVFSIAQESQESGCHFVGLRETSSLDEISTKMAEAFKILHQVRDENGIAAYEPDGSKEAGTVVPVAAKSPADEAAGEASNASSPSKKWESKPVKALSIYHKTDLASGMCTFTVAVPVHSSDLEKAARGVDEYNQVEGKSASFSASATAASLSRKLYINYVPQMKAHVLEHVGPYRHLGNAWAYGISLERCKVIAMDRTHAAWEMYHSDPGSVKNEDFDTVTRLYLPLKVHGDLEVEEPEALCREVGKPAARG